MNGREVLEAIELDTLAPYAVKSRFSRGRRYPEEEHPFRTAFQRDRDRIIHTTAFRRLEYKTQVFVTDEGDYYRTRLTHTLETAQIARTLALALLLNEELVEAISLGHDLGHPPFGHAGERCLHRLMADKGGFNHNTQSLRIVEVLERRYPGFPGLNLTWEVREGIIKHVTEYDASEATGYEPERRATLEAQIVNLADEIAYNTHDLDDGLRSQMLSPEDMEGLALWEEAAGAIGEEFSEMTRHRIVRHLIDLEVTDVIEATHDRLKELKPQAPEDIRLLPEQVVGFSKEMREKHEELKRFLFQRLYRHYRVVRMQVKAERFLGQLFQAYLEEPEQLPREVQERMTEEEPARVVCDYVAGMTDRFALDEYKKLFDPLERV